MSLPLVLSYIRLLVSIISLPSSMEVHSFILFYLNSIYLCLFSALPGLHWCVGFSLVAERRGFSPCAVCREEGLLSSCVQKGGAPPQLCAERRGSFQLCVERRGSSPAVCREEGLLPSCVQRGGAPPQLCAERRGSSAVVCREEGLLCRCRV